MASLPQHLGDYGVTIDAAPEGGLRIDTRELLDHLRGLEDACDALMETARALPPAARAIIVPRIAEALAADLADLAAEEPP